MLKEVVIKNQLVTKNKKNYKKNNINTNTNKNKNKNKKTTFKIFSTN